MGRPRKQPENPFHAGQMVEPTELYVGEIGGHVYRGIPGETRLDGGAPQVREWPHLHKLIDPEAWKEPRP